jgi:anthranilate synthase component 2
MILMIDNYDSFTYNLVQYLGELGAEIAVYRNDMITVAEIRAQKPTHLVISPGPGDPTEGGISMAAIAELGGELPILGVCLGQQAIGAVYGGQVVRANHQMHGKTSLVYHLGDRLFNRLPNPFRATRYHSLIVAEPLPDCLTATAFTSAGELMGLRHKTLPTFGVQFHPESILTEGGKQLLQNFLEITL